MHEKTTCEERGYVGTYEVGDGSIEQNKESVLLCGALDTMDTFRDRMRFNNTEILIQLRTFEVQGDNKGIIRRSDRHPNALGRAHRRTSKGRVNQMVKGKALAYGLLAWTIC